MSNRIYGELVKERLNEFVTAFQTAKEIFWDADSKKLIHPGEFGSYRENTVRKLFRLFLPEYLGIGSGFVINNIGEVSTQCDLIIYDKNYTAIIESDLDQRFFPVESVVGVIEVKSDIQNKTQLNSYLNKLADIKRIRENIKSPAIKRNIHSRRNYKPLVYPQDQIHTFLICNKFGFNFKMEDIKYDTGIKPSWRHSVILSIKDGTLSYKLPSEETNVPVPYSFLNNIANDYFFTSPSKEDISDHLKYFLTTIPYLQTITVLDPDMVTYLYEDYKSLN